MEKIDLWLLLILSNAFISFNNIAPYVRTYFWVTILYKYQVVNGPVAAEPAI